MDTNTALTVLHEQGQNRRLEHLHVVLVFSIHTCKDKKDKKKDVYLLYTCTCTWLLVARVRLNMFTGMLHVLHSPSPPMSMLVRSLRKIESRLRKK